MGKELVDNMRKMTQGNGQTGTLDGFISSSTLPDCDELYAQYSMTKENPYPCVVVMASSAFSILTMAGDGNIQMGEISTRGGRTFMALGSLLTGAKSYDEMVDLASKGDGNKVHTVSGDVSPTNDKYGLYLPLPDNLEVFMMGNALGKDISQFKREDLAHAILSMTISDIYQCACLFAKSKNINNIYFGGAFFNSEIMRNYLSFYMARCICRTPNTDEHPNIQVLQMGPYFGVLGAWISATKNNNTL